MDQQEIIPHLFRTEFSKITAVLCRLFGIEHIETAEDIASNTFLAAMESWPLRGVPENPSAWLYAVAKNKAKNYLTRQTTFSEKVAEELKASSGTAEEPDIDLSDKNITDSQLQMLFAICHPVLSVEAQIGLALRILCGFGIDEIANAFLTQKETINKRLYRAREKLRHEKIPIEFPAEEEIHQRLDSVLTTLYLLFSEGYYSESKDTIIREDLCAEAMRLTYLLLKNESTNLPAVNALFSLMCFQASRLEARRGENGELILYEDQDESKWNAELIAKGGYYLSQASQGDKVSRYHLEAGIAYWHTIKTDTKEKWENILQLYNRLLVVEYSPVAALNRTFVLSKVYGKEKAIEEAEKLHLVNNHFYFTLLGELYTDIDPARAKLNFNRALALATTATDKKVILDKINRLEA